MPAHSQSRSRTDVAAVLLIAFMLAALLAPALAASNAKGDKTQCMNRMRDLVIALQNAHDTYGAFPLASTQPLDHPPGTAGEKPSGYSWLTRLLPFMEQQVLYNHLANAKRSNKLRVPPFDPVVMTIDEKTSRAVMAEPVPAFVCPIFIGGPTVTDAAPEYAALAADTRPAVTTYHATAGSHFFNTDGLGRMIAPEQLGNFAYEGNGIIAFPGKVGDKLVVKGHGLRSVSDGTSKTFFITESNEQAYAAWIDGQTTWVVSAWPNNPDVPTPQVADTPQPVLGWPAEQLSNNKVTPGAQKDIGAKDEPPIYLPLGRWTGKAARTWGASSNHPEGIGHGFADGHVAMLARDIDPVVYLHLTTRNGREVIDQDAIK